MEKTVVEHSEVPSPYGAYSTAVRAEEFVFISGQAVIVPETGAKAGEDCESRARQAFENFRIFLECFGSSMADVVKGTAKGTRLAAGQGSDWLLRMAKRASFKYFKTSPEIIRLAVILYIRFPLSLRNVEDLLHERGLLSEDDFMANRAANLSGWRGLCTA